MFQGLVVLLLSHAHANSQMNLILFQDHHDVVGVLVSFCPHIQDA